MSKTFSSVVMIAFAGLVCTSLLAVFTGPMIESHHLGSHLYGHLYFMAY